MLQQHCININTNQNSSHSILRINGSNPDMGKDKNVTQRGHITPDTKGIENPPTKKGGHVTILLQVSGPHNPGSFGGGLCESSKEQWNNIPSHQTTVRLMWPKSRCHNKIQAEQHGSPHSHLWIVLFMISGPQQSLGVFWGGRKNLTKKKTMELFSSYRKLLKYDGISFWDGVCSSLCQHQGGYCIPNHIRVNGTSTTGHTNAIGQLNL